MLEARWNSWGFTIFAAGVQPNNSKIKEILEFPQPTDGKLVRRFIGMIIRDLAAVARSFTALTWKGENTGTRVSFVKWHFKR